MNKLLIIFLSFVSPVFLPATHASISHDVKQDSVSVNVADSVEVKPMPHLKLDSLYLDLGLFYADSIAEGVMRFHNTGDAPLVITNIFSDCGCTVPDYSRKPVMPGDSGEIKVRFDGRGRHPGEFRKSLRIRSNADNKREIFFVKGKIRRKYRR